MLIFTQFQTSVANPSCNEYAESNLKIIPQRKYTKFISTTKTHNLTLFFQRPFIVSRK